MERNPWQSQPYLHFPFLVSYRMPYSLGFPGGSDGKESAYNGVRVRYLDWEDPLEKGIATHSSILACLNSSLIDFNGEILISIWPRPAVRGQSHLLGIAGHPAGPA